MTYLSIQPEVMTAAVTDFAGIRSALAAANAAAAAPTTGVVASGADEISAACTSLFNTYALEYRAAVGRLSASYDEFTQALVAAGTAYAETELVNAASALTSALGPVSLGVQSMQGAAASGAAAGPLLQALDNSAGTVTTLVMGASGYPIPSQQYIDTLPALYFKVRLGTLQGLSTPEGLYPFTGVKDLTLNVSVARGVTILNDAIQSAITSGNSTINVFGYSQSAVIASIEMHNLDPTNTPGGSLLPGVNLNFSLVGDPANPNGGLLTRFPGLTFSSLGITFGTATPDNSFPTTIYTIEYDGFADFPQYPIDPFADLNALAGIVALHGTYPYVPATQVDSAIQLNTVGSPLTQYYIIPSQNLPLLAPVRAIPVIGHPIADLLQPDLTALVNWGYGNPSYGYSTSPANVPTPFGVIPPLSDTTALGPALVEGTQQGIGAFVNDIGAEVSSLPNPLLSGAPAIAAPVLGNGTGIASTLSSLQSFITALQAANTNFTGAIATSFSAAYGTLLPTADIATSLAISVPSYDINLFLNGVLQMTNGNPVGGLVYALGAPVSADLGLDMLAASFEFRVLYKAASTIYYTLTGTPEPPIE